MPPTEPQKNVEPAPNLSSSPTAGIIPPAGPAGQPSPSQPSFNQKQVKKGSHKIAIVVAIVVVAVIISALIYIFVMQKNETAPVPTQEAQPAPSETVDPASPEGVDQTIQSIDQSLNSVNDQADFTPNDISDDTLGL